MAKRTRTEPGPLGTFMGCGGGLVGALVGDGPLQDDVFRGVLIGLAIFLAFAFVRWVVA